MAKRFNRSQLLALANEEKKTAVLYRKYGFWRFARDEAKHASMFKRLAKRRR